MITFYAFILHDTFIILWWIHAPVATGVVWCGTHWTGDGKRYACMNCKSEKNPIPCEYFVIVRSTCIERDAKTHMKHLNVQRTHTCHAQNSLSFSNPPPPRSSLVFSFPRTHTHTNTFIKYSSNGRIIAHITNNWAHCILCVRTVEAKSIVDAQNVRPM